MAIIIEKENKKTMLVPVLVTLGIILVLVGVAWYLFNPEDPAIDALSTPEAQQATQISSITFDTRSITELPVYALLDSHVGDPAPGSFGRENPFLPFIVLQGAPIVLQENPTQ